MQTILFKIEQHETLSGTYLLYRSRRLCAVLGILTLEVVVVVCIYLALPPRSVVLIELELLPPGTG